MFHLKPPTFTVDEAKAAFYLRDGTLYWKVGNYKGKPAGHVDQFGYRIVQFKGSSWRAHRIVWYMETGGWPYTTMDHIDGNYSNNAFSNLRVVPPVTNSRNRRIRSDNTSGVTGYSVFRVVKHHAARWKENGKTRTKSFLTEQEARDYVALIKGSWYLYILPPKRKHQVRWCPENGKTKTRGFETKEDALSFLTHIDQHVKAPQGYTPRHGK